MENKFVYLAGAIARHSYGQVTNWRNYVARRFAPGVVGISPMRMKTWCKRYNDSIPSVYDDLKGANDAAYLISGAPNVIGRRDFADVQRADMVFFYLPKEHADKQEISVGTLIEFGWASALRKPTVVVSDDDSRVLSHPLILAHASYVLPTLALGIAAVNAELSAYVEKERSDD